MLHFCRPIFPIKPKTLGFPCGKDIILPLKRCTIFYAPNNIYCGYMLPLSVWNSSYRKVLLANTVNPDQMSDNAASDLGLYCLFITLLRVSR